MDVEATHCGGVQNGLREYQAVSDDYHYICCVSCQRLLGFFVTQGGRLLDRDPGRFSQLFDRAGLQLLAPSCAPVRLRVNRYDFMLAGKQGLQVTRGKLGRTREEYSQCFISHRGSGSLPVGFFEFLANTLAFEGRYIVDEKLAIEMVDFVLQTNGEQPLQFPGK